jgi:hypothetical protein
LQSQSGFLVLVVSADATVRLTIEIFAWHTDFAYVEVTTCVAVQTACAGFISVDVSRSGNTHRSIAGRRDEAVGLWCNRTPSLRCAALETGLGHTTAAVRSRKDRLIAAAAGDAAVAAAMASAALATASIAMSATPAMQQVAQMM